MGPSALKHPSPQWVQGKPTAQAHFESASQLDLVLCSEVQSSSAAAGLREPQLVAKINKMLARVSCFIIKLFRIVLA